MAMTGLREVERGCYQAALLVVGSAAAAFGYLLLASPARAADPLPGPLSGALAAVTPVDPVAPLVAAVLEPAHRWPLDPVTGRASALVVGQTGTSLTGLVPPELTPVGPAPPHLPGPTVAPDGPAAAVARSHRPSATVGLSLPGGVPYDAPVGGPVPPGGPAPMPPLPLWWLAIPSQILSAATSAGDRNERSTAPGQVPGSPVLAPPTRRVAARADEPRLPRGPPCRPGFRPD